MNTLRKIGDFVGIPQDSGEFGFEHPISLGYIRFLLNGTPLGLSDKNIHPFSMQDAIQELKQIPPIKLAASLIGSNEGDEPFLSVIRIETSPGLIISTRIHYESEGRMFMISENVGATGGHLRQQLGPGSWILTVRRSGIGNSGYRKLEKKFNIRVRRQSEPNPGEQPPPPPLTPQINVTFSGSIENASFLVTGSGFSKTHQSTNQGVAIRVVDANALIETRREYTKLLSDSGIDHVIRGDLRGLTLNALGIATIAFSATDGRPNPGDRTDFLWSNTVRIDFRR